MGKRRSRAVDHHRDYSDRPEVPLGDKGPRCHAVTVMDPEDIDPEILETVVKAVCINRLGHKGWHMSQSGYAWSPDDDGQHIQLNPPEGARR